jgi:hypothetical protein
MLPETIRNCVKQVAFERYGKNRTYPDLDLELLYEAVRPTLKTPDIGTKGTAGGMLQVGSG